MIRRFAAVLPLALGLALAGCAGGGTGPEVATAGGAPNATAIGSDEERTRQFTECMRGEGIAMDDAKPGKPLGEIRADNKRKFGAAYEKCRHLLPNGGAPPTLSPADLDKMRQYAACMREHGVPDFPDPKPNGDYKLDLSVGQKLKNNPHFKSADEACKQLLPGDRAGGKAKGGKGGGS